MVFRRHSESSNAFKSTACEMLFLGGQERFGHHGGGQDCHLHAQSLRVRGARIAELQTCKAPGSGCSPGRVQRVVCVCVCVCVLRRVCLGTEEHSLWGRTKGGGQGAGWGSMCGARELSPGSSEKPWKGRHDKVLRRADQESETGIVRE